MKPKVNSKVVLDASAVLALMHQEKGEALVSEYIQKSETVISAVNLAEVLSKQQEIGIPVSEALALLDWVGILVVPFDQKFVLQVAELRKSTKSFGLTLGDRVCLALGQSLGCPVLTADQAWKRLDLGIEIVLIR